MLRAEIRDPRGSGDHATAQELCGTDPGSLSPSWVPTCLPVHPLPPYAREETAPSRRPAAPCRRGTSSRRSPVCRHGRDRGGEGAALPGARPCSGELSRQRRAPRGPGGPGSDRPRPCHHLGRSGSAALPSRSPEPVCPGRPVRSARDAPGPGGGARDKVRAPTRPLSASRGQRVGFGSESPMRAAGAPR